MIEITFSPIKFAIFLIVALFSTILFKLILGENRDKYFKVTLSKSLFNQRGALANAISLGYPKNLKGFLLFLVLILLYAIEYIFVMIFF